MRVAVLSNVNVDYIIVQMKKYMNVCCPEGYGDIWGQLLNRKSSVNQYKPEAVVIIVDISQLLNVWQDTDQARAVIDEWFDMFEQCRTSAIQYLISDIKFRDMKILDLDEFCYDELENYWKDRLCKKIKTYNNTHRLRLCDAAESIGVGSFYSAKTWYLGKMPYSEKGSSLLIKAVKNGLRLMEQVPKKVLVLDLDGTLWGGVIGECGLDGIQLSDEGIGAVFRDVQIMIKNMKERGVLLAVCSKNNRDDVQTVWSRHSHMILQEEDFAAGYINWDDKAENLRKISRDLNLGLDAFVFVDDVPAERENIRYQLPMVAVPEFPSVKDDIPVFFQQVYQKYFMKIRTTDEDIRKTQQYQENRARNLSRKGMDYTAFLKDLGLRTERVVYDEKSKGRVVQLIGKTNQFNLTGRRYSQQELDEKAGNGWEVYAYRVSDKFGDYGIVAVIIVDMSVPVIDTFLMSCRVMGRQLENYFIDQVEEELAERGMEELEAEYIPSGRNIPVKDLYENLGYKVIEQDTCHSMYKINLRKRPVRRHFVLDSERRV